MTAIKKVKTIEFKYFIPMLQKLRKYAGSAEFDEEAGMVHIHIYCAQAGILGAEFSQAVVDCIADHPYRWDDRKKPTSPTKEIRADQAEHREIVAKKVGEHFYEQQAAMIEGWSIGEPAPVGLVLDEGKAVHQIKRGAGYSFKPDTLPARPTARIQVPAWLAGVK